MSGHKGRAGEFRLQQFKKLLPITDLQKLAQERLLKDYILRMENTGRVKVIMRDGVMLDPPEWISPLGVDDTADGYEPKWGKGFGEGRWNSQ